MDLASAARDWRHHGFVILPGYLLDEVLWPAVAELDLMFPSAQGFHDESDPRRKRYLDDEFAGIDTFPFASTQISLLAVHDRLIHLAQTLLQGNDLRIYSAEAWAKFTGAADYDQDLHRDYLNHTVVVPSDAPGYQQLEVFIFLVDVPEDLGPPQLVSKTLTTDIAAKPNWLLRHSPKELADPTNKVDTTNKFVAAAHPHLYDHEVSAAGPAGTVVAFEQGTFHRGTGMTRRGGARYTMHVNYRRAEAEWGHRHAWANRSHEPAWYRFVERASPRQLELFGFPPPGHRIRWPAWRCATPISTCHRGAIACPGLPERIPPVPRPGRRQSSAQPPKKLVTAPGPSRSQIRCRLMPVQPDPDRVRAYDQGRPRPASKDWHSVKFPASRVQHDPCSRPWRAERYSCLPLRNGGPDESVQREAARTARHPQLVAGIGMSHPIHDLLRLGGGVVSPDGRGALLADDGAVL